MQIWNRDIWTSYHHKMDHISNHQTIWMVFFCNLVILVSSVFLQLQDNLGVPHFFSVFPNPKAWHWPRQRLNFPSRCPPKGQAFTARLLRKLPHRLGAQVAGCNLGVGVLGWDGGMDGLGLGEVFVPKKHMETGWWENFLKSDKLRMCFSKVGHWAVYQEDELINKRFW